MTGATEWGTRIGGKNVERPQGPNKISAATKYSFTGKNLTAYGGLLPMAAMLEKLGFQQLVRESVNLDRKRMPRAMVSDRSLG
ncbi:MAG: hypothetical protein ACK5TN_01675 [Acidobacteriota bacterium]